MRRQVFALLGAALACSSPTEPNVPTLEFEEGIVFGIPTLPTRVIAEPRTLLVTGVIQTPTAGYSLFGTLTILGPHVLRLDIDAYETIEGLSFLSQNYFRARVRNLPSDDFLIEVYHTKHTTPDAAPIRVYSGTVRIP